VRLRRVADPPHS